MVLEPSYFRFNNRKNESFLFRDKHLTARTLLNAALAPYGIRVPTSLNEQYICLRLQNL
jgi:hypothetical protein